MVLDFLIPNYKKKRVCSIVVQHQLMIRRNRDKKNIDEQVAVMVRVDPGPESDQRRALEAQR